MNVTETNIYMHLLMVISRDPPNWDVTAVSPADQWELRNTGRVMVLGYSRRGELVEANTNRV
jgi:hypothetical protein